jgi:hypothetical protein
VFAPSSATQVKLNRMARQQHHLSTPFDRALRAKIMPLSSYAYSVYDRGSAPAEIRCTKHFSIGCCFRRKS